MMGIILIIILLSCYTLLNKVIFIINKCLDVGIHNKTGGIFTDLGIVLDLLLGNHIFFPCDLGASLSE